MDLSDFRLEPKAPFYASTYEHLGLTLGTLQCAYLPGHIADHLGKIELQHLVQQLDGLPLVICGPSKYHAGTVFYRK